ncbi:thiamine-phosphate kinase [Idiomarina seosinensis]|uniref:Thiamine-monophosphate kinase n=1 Tax=Idiomarina seosinensis TaxID=281739 RepID=A0A432ZD39_9GAMM|nr:thiamine-phosphate kinase [Idiomarina seosinensis]RUO75282.1 thiamine-phosphate kinase [Idiomarina seosinensis]
MLNEFSLIEQYFLNNKKQRPDSIVGIGDDGAVTRVQPNHDLVTVTDTMVNGVHFDESTPPRAIGHKIVAVNLSDLAAMGAEPCWISLALTLPDADETWLSEFAAGLHEICQYYDCTLIGGDTTRGPLTVTVTAQGQVPAGEAITRSGAKPGDWLYVSGPLGDAGLGLDMTQQADMATGPHLQRLVERLYYPHPRVALGQTLRNVAGACIDISDGLLADLQHLLSSSGVAADIELDKIPLSLAMTETLSQDAAYKKALTAGDDYELCFTVEEHNRGRLETLTAHLKNKPICIGRITQLREPAIQFKLHGEVYELPLEYQGYNHFNNSVTAKD